MSRFGIGYDVFLDLTPKEVYLAFKDHVDREKDKTTAVTRVISESIRKSTMHLMNIQIGKGRKIKKETELWSYSWDEEQGNFKEPQTLNEMKDTMKTMAGVSTKKRETK